MEDQLSGEAIHEETKSALRLVTAPASIAGPAVTQSKQSRYLKGGLRLLVSVLSYPIVTDDDLDIEAINRPRFEGDPGNWFRTPKSLVS